jgi:hypothetical protein
VPVDSVARAIDPGLTLPADLSGEDLIRAIRDHPAPSYLVMSGSDLLGVVRVVDMDRVLRS